MILVRTERVNPPVITDEEIRRITGIPKSIGTDMGDLLDQSRIVHSGRPADVNRRRSVPIICEGYDLHLEIRITLKDPDDISVSLLLSTVVDDTEVSRTIARYDCKGEHSMAAIGLPDLEGPHMHILTERYQRAGKKDGVWAVRMEGDRLEDALEAVIKCFGIHVDGKETEMSRCHARRASQVR